MIRVVVSEGNGGGALNHVDFSEGLLRMCGKFCIFAPDFTKTMRQNAIIIVNGAKRMAEMFGHSNNFATLSLWRSPVTHLLRTAGSRASIYGFLCRNAREASLFFVPHAAEGKLQ